MVAFYFEIKKEALMMAMNTRHMFVCQFGNVMFSPLLCTMEPDQMEKKKFTSSIGSSTGGLCRRPGKQMVTCGGGVEGVRGGEEIPT